MSAIAIVWIAALLFVLLRGVRGSDAQPPAALAPLDLLLAASIAVAAAAVRVWPLFTTPWINAKPDEGVYLGAAWLLRDGSLPYRDYVLAHLPGALLMLQPAVYLIGLWQDNSPALLAARATAACADGCTAGLVYLIARQLVQRPGAVLAGLVYAGDALAIEYSRAVMLEPLQAPWLALGALGVCATLRGRRWSVPAGISLAIGCSIKISGGVVLLAAILALLLARRRRAALELLVGAAIGALAICGWLLWLAGDELPRQALLLQLGRPRDAAAERLRFLLADRRSIFTAASMLLGTAALALQARRRSLAAPWRFVALWCVLELLLFVGGASFYEHYIIGLLPAMALLAAALPQALARLPQRRLAEVALVLLLAPPVWWQAGLWLEVDRRPTGRDEVALLRALPPGKPVLSWIALYNILAGRPISQAPGGPYLLDTFLGDQYLDSALNHRWPDAARSYAQAAGAADYILGARYQTSELPGIRSQFIWRPVNERNATVLFTRVDQPATTMIAGADLELLGRTEAARIEQIGGQRFVIQPLHWRAAHKPPDDYALALHLVDAGGQRLAQLDVPVNGGIAWEPGIITTIEYRLPLPAGLPEGSYGLRAAVYSWQDGTTLPWRSLQDGPLEGMLELMPVQIE